MNRTVHFSPSSSATILPFESLQSCAEMTVARLGAGMIGLSGGSTYMSLFRLWAKMRPDCSSAEFFPVDERKTPFEDDASNWGTATRLFLEPVGRAIDQRNHAVDAKTYEKILHERFGSREIVFDTIFLGVGADGHTASLFPGCTCLNDRDSIVLETESPKPPTGRVTLAPRPLLAARKLIVIVAGESKQEAARGILEKDQRLPVVRILSARPESDVYIGASLL